MRKKRDDAGAIDFGDNEVRFILDEKGVPLKVVRKERIETNLLIEEFMLLCNREVSLYVSKLAEKLPEKTTPSCTASMPSPKKTAWPSSPPLYMPWAMTLPTIKRNPTPKTSGIAQTNRGQARGAPDTHRDPALDGQGYILD